MARSSGCKSLAALVALSLSAALTAHGAPIPLVPSFGEFALRDPADPPPPGPPVFYAPTGPGPTWQIAQWNIPGGRLSPFSVSRSGDRETLTSTAPEATVRIIRDAHGQTIELSQDGAVLPCTDAHGAPRESDLAFGPNALMTSNVALAGLRSLKLTTTVSVRYGMTAHPKGCMVNQGAALVSVVLDNLSRRPPQTLFYKFSLNPLCGPGPASRVRSCENWTKAPGFYFTHAPFGVDDWLPLLGQPYLKEGEQRTIEIDLLPRLKQIIRSGPNEMDHDPSHWVVNSAYAGQHIWGDFKLAATWSAFRLVANTE